MEQIKPTIFISSTIYDFRDLRSALKYWLEELGYEVMLSEFNDFSKPLDENSYNACIKAIERANYFILLIGARTGGFVKLTEKISITRMEYRTAYDLVKAGKMKLITFVRQDLWNVKEDRKSLEKILIENFSVEKELSSDDIQAISKHQSNLLNDAEATFSFLNEIGRISEMKQAINGNADFPKANWIHPFNSFKDIVDALNTVFSFKDVLSKASLTINLTRELLTNLTHLTFKVSDDVLLTTYWANPAWRSFTKEYKGTSRIPLKEIQSLGFYLMFKSSADKLSTQFIDQALNSGVFLDYNFEKNIYEIGLIHESLYKLKENIRRFRSFEDNLYREEKLELIDKYLPKNTSHLNKDDEITVDNETLLYPFAVYNCEQNITYLCVSLIKAIRGNIAALKKLTLFPVNPFPEQAKKVEAETTTIKDIENWIEVNFQSFS